ncbi:hypothetical protein QWY84_02935 [Aquisalimonas lutea]|uniref:hypothetical protein n=1 Tax=Aquisalimonas lutea TaxID=1327750 RepID=UPI0025B4E7FD|nr:hypothetical protein [Aquisalimonas lutea]MDN3516557.1 hypothetical protein [Aquisalimonas lutea]
MNEPSAYRTFADFEPGAFIGATRLPVTAQLKATWERIGTPAEGERLPPGLLVALLMRGYGEVVDRRPPGNVHAELDITFLDDRLHDDELRLSVHCADASLRKGRRWVELDTEQWSGQRCLTQARLTLLWAR